VLRLLALVLLGLLVFLQAKFWNGAGGWTQVQQVERAVQAQRAENAKLLQRNDALAAEVTDLKEGQDAVEERARTELGMIKPGEVYYRVVESMPDPAPAKPAEMEAQR
jgi:cell division protein FtsB